MDPEVKDLVEGAGIAAGAKLGLEAFYSYTDPQYAGTFPYLGFSDPTQPTIMIPPGDVWLACIGTPLLFEGLSRLKRGSQKLHNLAKGAMLYGIPEFLNVLIERGVWFAHSNGIFGPPGVGKFWDIPQSPSPFNIQHTFPSSSPNVIRQVPAPIPPQQNQAASLPWQRNMGW